MTRGVTARELDFRSANARSKKGRYWDDFRTALLNSKLMF